MDIYDFIRNQRFQVIVEIGAHWGFDTENFRSIFPNSRIVCFEPDPRNIDILQKKQIAEIYPYAVSDTNGVSRFYLSSGRVPAFNNELVMKSDWSFSSSLKKPTGHLQEHTWITFDNSVDVQTIRLDDFKSLQNTTVDFIWADVQGAEDLVFSGARELLKRTRYVYTEYSNKELYENQLNLKELLDLFGPEWRLVHDYGNDVLLENTTKP